jgi:hypothetical protein
MSFYDDEDIAYEFDYNRVMDEVDELYEYEDDYEPDEPEYEHYYHNVMDDLDFE